MRIFPQDLILHEEIKLVHQNYLAGLFCFLFVSCLIAGFTFSQTDDWRALVWLMVITLFCAIGLLRFLFFRDLNGINPRQEAATMTVMITALSLIFSSLTLMFIPTASPVVVMSIAIVTGGLASGSLAMHSSCFPIFLGFTAPVLIALIIGLLLRDEAIFTGLANGALLFLVAHIWFGYKIESSIRNSIELRFENDNLVRKLRSALTQTDDANRAKSVFLASASHDLRQPLHALGLLTETLGGTRLDEPQTEIQKHMMSAVESTRSMLGSLLNISKLDAGAISADPKPFLVQSIFAKLESELAPIADENNLIYRSRDTIAAANSDAFIVELILRNLIANAIRYTHNGGLLVACRFRKPNRLVIEVWDTGIGIPEGQTDDIFGEFKQIKNPERDAQKGFGLGLAIAQGLAKTIDTQITLSSTEGSGSVFRFELRATNAKVIEDIPKASKPADFNGRTVIVIDDDLQVRAAMQNLMISWGCHCMIAESARDAIGKVDGKKIDLMLVDYRLREGKTGREAIEDVREHLGEHVPAIIITGDTGTDRISEAQIADALLLHKPASTSQLLRMMHSLLKPIS